MMNSIQNHVEQYFETMPEKHWRKWVAKIGNRRNWLKMTHQQKMNSRIEEQLHDCRLLLSRDLLQYKDYPSLLHLPERIKRRRREIKEFLIQKHKAV